MPQLDFSAFFVQFLTISSLLFWLTWLLINNILEIIYMMIVCRNIIINYFLDLKFKYNYLLKKILNFKLNLFIFFQSEMKFIIIDFNDLIKFNRIRTFNFIKKLINVYKYFIKVLNFASNIQLKLDTNLIENSSFLNPKILNV